MDTFSKGFRHYNMIQIKSKNTHPEILVRKYLFSRGLRFRIHDKKLPGNPDIVLKKYSTVIFINGCFWHQHQGCKYATIPKDNREYWVNKFLRTRQRDKDNLNKYKELGWNVIIVWECELKSKLQQITLERIYFEVIYSNGPNNFNLNILKKMRHFKYLE